jgi:putative ABC transport system ATP-binding protein
MIVLEVRDLQKVFRRGEIEIPALRKVDLIVQKGEFVAIMGPSGSGKSSLLHLAGGLDVPDGGQVLLEGTDLATLDDFERTVLRRRRVGFVFQAFNLIPTLSALENVMLPLSLDGVSDSEARKRAQHTLDLVRLSSRENHYPSQLSGGEHQRVAIARALVIGPALILADEPTGNLDSEMGHHVISLLRGLVDDDRETVVLVTHDPEVASRADRIVRFRDGSVVS